MLAHIHAHAKHSLTCPPLPYTRLFPPHNLSPTQPPNNAHARTHAPQGTVFGRIELVRVMSASIDSLSASSIRSFTRSPGAIRVLISGHGPKLLRAGISISNNNITSEGERGGLRGRGEGVLLKGREEGGVRTVGLM